jgi:hypothetical protein
MMRINWKSFGLGAAVLAIVAIIYTKFVSKAVAPDVKK